MNTAQLSNSNIFQTGANGLNPFGRQSDIMNESSVEDDFDVIEMISSPVDPANPMLKQYMGQLSNDVGNTISDYYDKGDTRGNPIKKYLDALSLYSYVLSNLKNPKNKDLFKETFEPVISSMYSSRQTSTSYVDRELLRLGLRRTRPQYLKARSISYYMIEAYSNLDLKFAYIYIIKKTDTYVIPLSNGEAKASGGKTKTYDLSSYFEEKSQGNPRNPKESKEPLKPLEIDQDNQRHLVKTATNSLYEKTSDTGILSQFDTTGMRFKLYSLTKF